MCHVPKTASEDCDFENICSMYRLSGPSGACGSYGEETDWRMELLEAVEKNDCVLLQETLEAAGSHSTEDSDSLSSALISAASKGYLECVELLLRSGAACDEADPNSNTALILAAERGHTAVVKLLLKEGCHVNRTDLETRTALHWASMNGHLDIVSLLLQYGGIPDQKDQIYGFTPIMLAARQGHTSVLQLLLERPGNVDKTDKHGETALFDAVRNNRLGCVELLLKAGSDINHCDKLGRTPLLTAVLWKRKWAVLKLLQTNCHMEVPGSTGSSILPDGRRWTALETAVIEGNFELAQILAMAGAKLSTLHKHACSQEMLEVFGMSKEMAVWLTEIVKHPRSLKEECRGRIRELLGTSIHLTDNISKLPLPVTVQNYLAIPELAECLDAGNHAGHQGAAAGSDAGHQGTTGGCEAGHQETTGGDDAGHQETAGGRDSGHQETTDGIDTGHQETAGGQDAGHQETAGGSDAGHQKTAGRGDGNTTAQ